MAKKDHYKTLGVSKTDSKDTIKKNYKKLAMQYHPDKAPEDKKKEYEDKFKEINEAHTILSDDHKRREYDSLDSYQSAGSSDFSDILRSMFNSNSFQDDDYEDSKVGKDLRYRLTIDFEEAVFGVEKEILIRKDSLCSLCAGTGAEDEELDECTKCHGQGFVKINQRTPWGVIDQAVVCDKCRGEGQIPTIKCSTCKGIGVISHEEKIKIKIPKGIDNEQILKVRGVGNAVKHGKEGDLFLIINVREHKIFKRDGLNIYVDLEITFSQAALGCKLSVPTLSEELSIKIPAGIESGTVLRLSKKGIHTAGYVGDQFVNVKIKTPKKLTKAQSKIFEELSNVE